MSINDDILYKIDSEIAKDKEIVKLKREIERLGNELQIQIEDNVRLNEYIEELEKELELERKSRQLLTDDLANVCKISLKKENIIKEVREYIENLKTYPYLEKYYVKDILEIIE